MPKTRGFRDLRDVIFRSPRLSGFFWRCIQKNFLVSTYHPRCEYIGVARASFSKYSSTRIPGHTERVPHPLMGPAVWRWAGKIKNEEVISGENTKHLDFPCLSMTLPVPTPLRVSYFLWLCAVSQIDFATPCLHLTGVSAAPHGTRNCAHPCQIIQPCWFMDTVDSFWFYLSFLKILLSQLHSWVGLFRLADCFDSDSLSLSLSLSKRKMYYGRGPPVTIHKWAR